MRDRRIDFAPLKAQWENLHNNKCNTTNLHITRSITLLSCMNSDISTNSLTCKNHPYMKDTKFKIERDKIWCIKLFSCSICLFRVIAKRPVGTQCGERVHIDIRYSSSDSFSLWLRCWLIFLYGISGNPGRINAIHTTYHNLRRSTILFEETISYLAGFRSQI